MFFVVVGVILVGKQYTSIITNKAIIFIARIAEYIKLITYSIR